MLDLEVAKAIVDKTMSALHVNVNIMDITGTIIASGNPDRIGSYHSAAARVIRTGYRKIVTEDEASMTEGVEPGITLPISYKNKIIGALGMTGDPYVVEKYGELMVLSALLMIEQAETKEKIFLEQRAREALLLELFTGRYGDDEQLFLKRANMFNLDLNGTHFIMSVKFPSANQANMEALDYQKLKERIESRFINDKELEHATGCFVNDILAVIYNNNIGKTTQVASQIRIARKLQDILNEESNSEMIICIAGKCEHWKQISHKFLSSCEAIQIIEHAGFVDGIFVADDYRSECALKQLPQETQVEFSKSVLGPLLNEKEKQSKTILLDTLSAFFRNNMSVQSTAKELFIHRNTLYMRLNKIFEMTGYSPLKFNGAFVLKMALTIQQINKKVMQSED